MRFRKRVKVFPGFYLNFSRSGLSSTVAGVNLKWKKKVLTVDLQNNLATPALQGSQHGEIRSAGIDQLSSASMIELKESLNEAFKDKIDLHHEITMVNAKVKVSAIINIVSYILVIGFFVKYFKNTLNNYKEYLQDLKIQLQNCVVDIDIRFDSEYQHKYNDVLHAYKSLITSKVIWDITASVHQDTVRTRSAASNLVTRQPVKFQFDNIDIIRSSYSAFHFENKNGGDLYIYPAFVIITNDKKEFGLIDIKDLKLSFQRSQFLEEDKIPSDTNTIGKTWAKVNKNGTRDKRFSDNYEIPIVLYGNIDLKSNTGLNESYSFSNFEKTQQFYRAFSEYQGCII
jgi:hypothetical protein